MVDTALVLYWDWRHLATLGLLMLVVACFIGFRRDRRATPSPEARGWRTFDALLVALGIAHCALYLWTPNFADHGEPVIPLLASNYLHGGPVYADWTAGGAIVGSNYGPYVFLAQLPVLLWHPTIAGSKLVGMVFGLGAIAMLALAVRSQTGSRADAQASCALMIAMISFQLHFWFWNRPDSMLLAIAAACVLLFDRARPSVCLAGLGLLAGVAADLKLFGPIYVLPLALASLAMAPSWSAAAGPAATGAALFAAAAMLPFADGGFSLHGYLANLAMMPRQGFVAAASLEALCYGLTILLLPMLTWQALGAGREDRVMIAALVACVAAVALLAGKPGGGPPYMMPFIPISLYLAARPSSRAAAPRRAAIIGARRVLLCVVAAGAAPIWAHGVLQMAGRIRDWPIEAAKAAEARALFQQFPGSEMGANSGTAAERDGYYRVERAFLGQVTRFDDVNYADQRAAGVPASVLYPLIEGCRVPSWIVPREGGLLLGTGYGQRLFDDGAIDRFRATYHAVGGYRFYELWRCRAGDAMTGGDHPAEPPASAPDHAPTTLP